MKRITKIEEKAVQLNLLKYIDHLCRKNNIKYSLIGGSLIGAIRHKGMIPWDDDIDIILSKSNYTKLMNILKKNEHPYYKLLTRNNAKTYFLPFSKLVDVRTEVIETNSINQIENYGLFVDVFCYNNIPNDFKLRLKYIKKLKLYNNLLYRKKLNFKNESLKKNIIRFFKNIISYILGYEKIFKMIEKLNSRYTSKSSNYIISNWPIYKAEREIQKAENITEYIDTEFEGFKVMIFKNYDEILKTTFGDYMKLPPENERVSHNTESYWRDNK